MEPNAFEEFVNIKPLPEEANLKGLSNEEFMEFIRKMNYTPNYATPEWGQDHTGQDDYTWTITTTNVNEFTGTAWATMDAGTNTAYTLNYAS